jgi:hypothetical protein
MFKINYLFIFFESRVFFYIRESLYLLVFKTGWNTMQYWIKNAFLAGEVIYISKVFVANTDFS